ncbi:MAG: tetratricopeptide repeat protein [Alphaproteobacteria bacterium]|nr:tetratricopeptide repeat protein [Alphaproteobacteria bacterium]
MNFNKITETAINAQNNGQFDKAEVLYQEILRAQPRNPLALHNLGTLRFRAGDYKQAAVLIRQSIDCGNAAPEAFSNLGLALAAERRFDEALDAYKKAIALRPKAADNYNHMAVSLMEKGDLEEAVSCGRKAVALDPKLFLAHYNLGVALQRQGKPADAVNAFQEALSHFPNFPEAYCNLGLALAAQGKREDAVEAYKKAVALRPDFPEAYNNMGQPLNELGRFEEAAEAYRQAIARRPDYPEASINLAHTLRRNGRINDAINACRKALTTSPQNTKARVELVSLLRQTCAWHDSAADTRLLLSMIQDVEPFLLLSAPSSLAEQFFCARHWASQFTSQTPFSHDRSRSPSRLRIGYLSCDFHLHATSFLMAGLFEEHDRDRFEIFGYGYDRDDGSDIRKRVINGFDHFTDFSKVPSRHAARRIYEDKIDILVDLKGYTNGTRTDILTDRPAPIQVNYLGYPGTMGADFMDYILADAYTAPMTHQPFYTEKIVHLPHSYQPNDAKRTIAPLLQSRNDCGLPDEGFVFCCFNASFKLSPEFFAVWMRLLKAVPGSVLWLMAMQPEIEKSLREEAEKHGVAPSRLVFARAIPLQHHLARHNYADLFLDTLPYGAHTTASDALWAGLPVLTCLGDTFAGRVGASLLHAVGLPELIASSLEDYEAMALDLAQHPDKLACLKNKLAHQNKSAPLFDTKQYTRDLEAAYTHMWNLWCKERTPQAFAVADIKDQA